MIIKEQEEIINAPITDRILVQAGPGTGKTEVVAKRIAYLLASGMKPSQLLVLSFSRSAVKVLMDRVRDIKEVDPWIAEEMRHLSIRTFDSFSFRVLRQLGKTPIELLRRSYDDNIVLLLEEIKGKSGKALVDNKEIGLSRIRQVIVDELQDLTGLRANFVKGLLQLLTSDANAACTELGFTLLGDAHQAIYNFSEKVVNDKYRMSSQELIGWTRMAFAGLREVPLAKNLRSGKNVSAIVDEAARILDDASKSDIQRLDKLKKLLNKSCEADSFGSIVIQAKNSNGNKRVAVLCRDNSQVLHVGGEIRKQAQLKGAKFLVDVMSANSPHSVPSWIGSMLHKFEAESLSKNIFKKIYEDWVGKKAFVLPCNGDWEATWNILLRFSADAGGSTTVSMQKLRERMTWLDSLPDDEGEDDMAVVVTTIHQAKGREYDLVTLVPSSPSQTRQEEDVDEEARILFVGVSRAKEKAFLGDDKLPTYYNEKFNNNGRSRWHRWNKVAKGAHHDMELGISGDIDPLSFIDARVVGDVAKVQKQLLSKQNNLSGKTVILKKVKVDPEKNRYLYDIELEEPKQIIGRTTENVIFDLLKTKSDKQSLPVTIYGLSVKSVVTLSSPGGIETPDVPEPWNTSRLWLGVDLHGMSSFCTFWRK